MTKATAHREEKRYEIRATRLGPKETDWREAISEGARMGASAWTAPFSADIYYVRELDFKDTLLRPRRRQN